MNQRLLSLSFGLLALAAASALHAQTESRVSSAEIDAERSRITSERAAVNQRALQERTACYQKFAVEDCLSDSRRRQRAVLDRLKGDEARINDITRRERGSAALERLDRKAAPEKAQESATRQERSQKEQQGREDRAASHTASRASAASRSDDKQRSFENKQRAHAERLAREAARDARGPTEREQREAKLQRAEQHRLDVEKKNAQRKKPRAAPLPPAS